MKIVWASRHPITEGQAEDLATMFVGVDCIDIEHVNLTWFATSDAAEDIRRNCESWIMLVDRATSGVAGEQPVIAGVFPPVALEALFECDFSGHLAPRVLTPASRQAPELRASPDAPIPFAHVRWVQLASMA